MKYVCVPKEKTLQYQLTFHFLYLIIKSIKGSIFPYFRWQCFHILVAYSSIIIKE